MLQRFTPETTGRSGFLVGVSTTAFCIVGNATLAVLNLCVGNWNAATLDSVVVAAVGALYAWSVYLSRQHELLVRKYEADAQASEHAAALMKGQRDLMTRDLAARQPLDRRH